LQEKHRIRAREKTKSGQSDNTDNTMLPVESRDKQTQSRLGRAVNGPSSRVDRLRLLGNGVVPQCAAKAWVELVKYFKQSFDW